MRLLLALCWLYEQERNVRQPATATFAFAITNVVAANEQTSEPSGKCRARVRARFWTQTYVAKTHPVRTNTSPLAEATGIDG